jgi:hypothetical protein
VDLSFAPSPNFHWGLGTWGDGDWGFAIEERTFGFFYFEVLVLGFYDKGVVFGSDW